jgi:hypothetical protein
VKTVLTKTALESKEGRPHQVSGISFLALQATVFEDVRIKPRVELATQLEPSIRQDRPRTISLVPNVNQTRTIVYQERVNHG